MKLSLKQLKEYLLQGREIEFQLNGVNYFASGDFGSINKTQNTNLYYIDNDDTKETLIEGDIQIILDYEFEHKICLSNNINQFVFKHIL